MFRPIATLILPIVDLPAWVVRAFSQWRDWDTVSVASAVSAVVGKNGLRVLNRTNSKEK